jgi:hypothetical protein
MPRTPPSPADLDLIAAAAQRDAVVTSSQLERWRSAGLVPRNLRRGLGRGAGSASAAAPGAVDLLVWMARHARPGRRPYDLALLSFGEGLDIPEPTVRAAFTSGVDRLRLSAEDLVPQDSLDDPVEWATKVAEHAVASATAPTLIPARVRRIDRAFQAAGATWAPPEVAEFDPDRSDAQAATVDELLYMSVNAMLVGGQAFSAESVAQGARAMLPPGAASPFAHMIAHPEEGEPVPDGLMDEAGSLLVVTGDARDLMRTVVAETTTVELRTAWACAGAQREWARGLCDSVEAELAEAAPWRTCLEWAQGVFLVMPRLLLLNALRGSRWSPTDHAMAAVDLLLMRHLLRSTQALAPDASWELLRQAPLFPQFFHVLLEDVALPA